MASASFTVNGSPPTDAVSVTGGSSVSLALASTSGVRSVAWSFIGNYSPSATDPTITPSGTPSGATASFTMPVGAGQGYLLQCVVNGGVDAEGKPVTEQTAKAVIGVNAISGYVPFCAGETTERSATHGWISALNDMIAAALAAVGYTAPSGATAYRLTYSTVGDVNTWSSGLWGGADWVGVAAAYGDLPTTGAFRLGLGYGLTAKLASGADAGVLWSAGGGGNTDLYLGTGTFRHAYCNVGTDWVFQIGGATVATANTDGLSVTGQLVASAFVGIGSGALPTSGTMRVEDGFAIYGYKTGVPAGGHIISWVETGASVNIGGSEVSWVVTWSPAQWWVSGNPIAQMDADGLTIQSGRELDITGVKVVTSSETFERCTHAKIAKDAGADGAPVTVVSFSPTVGYRYTLKCKVVGEDASQDPLYDTEFTLKIRYPSVGALDVYCAAVTPDDYADPALGSCSVTYQNASTSLNLQKTNASGTALTFSGEIVVAAAELVGT